MIFCISASRFSKGPSRPRVGDFDLAQPLVFVEVPEKGYCNASSFRNPLTELSLLDDTLID